MGVRCPVACRGETEAETQQSLCYLCLSSSFEYPLSRADGGGESFPALLGPRDPGAPFSSSACPVPLSTRVPLRSSANLTLGWGTDCKAVLTAWPWVSSLGQCLGPLVHPPHRHARSRRVREKYHSWERCGQCQWPNLRIGAPTRPPPSGASPHRITWPRLRRPRPFSQCGPLQGGQ